MLRLLADSGRSFSVKELADQLGSSKATVQRDLATLSSEFALIEESAGKQKKVYRIDQTIRALETITFGTMELLAVHAALAASGGFAGSPFSGDLQQVAVKLRGFLSPRHNGGLDAMARVFLPHRRGQIALDQHSDIIDQLADAIARRRICRAVYHAAWKQTTREHQLKPLRLVWHRSCLYLLACIVGKQDITTLAVHRFGSMDVTEQQFAEPRVDIDGHVQKAFGIFVGDGEQDVEILFEPDIAWRIQERMYHPDEIKTELADGRLRYQIRSSAQWEIVPWVLSFGPLATLVKPECWRTCVSDMLEATLPRYQE